MKCGDATNPGGPYIRDNGQPCKRDVKPGMTRCSIHGGASPMAKIKAEQMLAIARVPAIEALSLMVEQYMNDTCGFCQYPKGDTDEKRAIIQAARTILDRTGMGPRATIELTKQNDGDVNLELLTLDEQAQLVMHLRAIKDIKDAVRARQSRGLGPTVMPLEHVSTEISH